ncbi:MAG: hypothetical protein V3W41_16905 [Planctomycetota bacterium]
MDHREPTISTKSPWRRLRAAAGVLIWTALVGGGLTTLRQSEKHSLALARMGQQLVGSLEVIEIRFPLATGLGRGSRLRVEQGESLFQAGEVLSWREDSGEKVARVSVYPEYRQWLGEGAGFIAYETSGDIAWIIKTLFPPRVRQEILELLTKRWKEQRDTLLRRLGPGLIRLGDDLARALRDDFKKIVAEHRDDLDIMGRVLRERAWDGHIEKNFQEEIWPIVQERATPLVVQISEELIEAFPLFDFSWSYLLQKVNLSGSGRVQAELREFMTKKGVPILKSHDKQFREAAIQALKEVAASDHTRRAFERAFHDVSHDDRFREALTRVLSKWLLENEAVREIMSGLWDRDDLRRPLERFMDRLTPDIHRIANSIVLNDAGDGIDPELARVLRRKILREDERWILLDPSPQELGKDDKPPSFKGRIGGIR